MVTLPASTLERFRRFSLYNSPYPAHDAGCAVDLYHETNEGLSPVSGEILDTRTVRCPPKEYAVDEDHLIVVAVDEDCLVGDGDIGADSDGDGGDDDAGDDAEYVARILHVDPAVEPGDRVAVGDSLGEMVRSGFFGQWVDNHVHLGFRRADQNPYRAGGSLPLSLDVDVAGVSWEGRGTVVETGETYVRLDAPGHPGDGWAAIASDEGAPLDGGLVHYAGGGALGGWNGRLSLLGTPVGDADGRNVAWRDVAVYANGTPVVGLSLFASRGPFGAKLVAFDHEFAVDDDVRVEIRASDDPIRLG